MLLFAGLIEAQREALLSEISAELASVVYPSQ